MNEFIERLQRAGISNAKNEFIWLAAHALGVSNAGILSREIFSPEELAKIERVISRRENHEPLQYILGSAFFYGREFFVGPGVLIPREDTETLITAAKKFLNRGKIFSLLDWGTGSGCIAITILLEFPNSFAFMLDTSEEALTYARKNLERYNLLSRAKIIHEVKEKIFDVVFSNPPYIPSHEINSLMEDVKNFEPLSALDGGNDGMKFYPEIISLAKNFAFLEIGNYLQFEKLKSSGGFVGEVRDSGNFPRCIVINNVSCDPDKFS